jgi:hypothetical protein
MKLLKNLPLMLIKLQNVRDVKFRVGMEEEIHMKVLQEKYHKICSLQSNRVTSNTTSNKKDPKVSTLTNNFHLMNILLHSI